MYSRLNVRSFRGLLDLELPGLAPVTLLSGLNNAGKSAVLEALFLHASGPIAGQLGATTLREFRGEPGLQLDNLGTSSPWDELFFDLDVTSTISIEAMFDNVESELRLRKSDEYSSQLPEGLSGNTSVTTALDIQIEGDREPAQHHVQLIQATQMPNVPGGFGSINVSLSLNPPGKPPHEAYLLSQKTRTNSIELSRRYTDLVRQKRGHELVRVMRLLAPDIETLEILAPSGQPALHARIANGPTLPLSVMGEGINLVAEYMTAVLSRGSRLVLIDEIENGLHHTKLRSVWDSILRLTKGTGIQVVATTHSEECLQAAFDASESSPNSLQLLRLTRDDRTRGLVEGTPYDHALLGTALSERLDVR